MIYSPDSVQPQAEQPKIKPRAKLFRPFAKNSQNVNEGFDYKESTGPDGEEVTYKIDSIEVDDSGNPVATFDMGGGVFKTAHYREGHWVIDPD
ncbi:MAG: hypothetical protein WCO09_04060 [bacterium]